MVRIKEPCSTENVIGEREDRSKYIRSNSKGVLGEQEDHMIGTMAEGVPQEGIPLRERSEMMSTHPSQKSGKCLFCTQTGSPVDIGRHQNSL